MADRISASDSTKGGYAAALKRFDEFQTARSDPVFSDLKELHIRDEHLNKLMLDYGTYLAKTDLPYGNRASITAESKGRYFTSLKDSLKAKFPDHHAWTTEATWFTDLKNDIEKGATRTNLLSNEAFDQKTKPFYPVVKDEFVRMKHRELILSGEEDGYAIDMRSLSSRLVMEAKGTPVLKAGPLQQRAWFVLSMLAVGRGGEIQFQRYDEWDWDVLFQGIDSTWTEIKTLTQHCMMFGPDKESYECDFFHAFGCFYSVEKGLYRRDDVDKAIHKFVFPDLHAFVSSGVAAKLTIIMRKYVSPAVSNGTSSRSIRKGCTTFLTVHPSVTEHELNARGGWAASETNSKSYKETTPCLTIPGLNALAQWTDVRSPKYPPRLECLGDSVQVKVKLEEFMKILFITDLPAFQPEGALRPFLRACTASMIMYHFRVAKDYGQQNLVVEKVVDAATRAQICDGALLNPVAVLRKWSRAIKADFVARNPDHLDPALHGVGACLAQCNANMQKLMEVTGAVKTLAEDQQRSIDHLGVTLASVSQAVQRQESPQRRRSPGIVAPSVSNDDDGTAVAELQQTANQSTEFVGKRRFDFDQVEADRAPKRHSKEPVSRAFLQHTSLADAAGQSSAKTPISDILVFMYKSGLIPARSGKDRLGCINLTHLDESAKYKAAMELVECVISDEQWNQLRMPGRSERDTLMTASAVETLCLKELRAWEEAAGLKAPLANPKKARDQGYYIGVGARIVTYKKRLGITGHLSTALQPAPKTAVAKPPAKNPAPKPAAMKSGASKSSTKAAPKKSSVLDWAKATKTAKAPDSTDGYPYHEI